MTKSPSKEDIYYYPKLEEIECNNKKDKYEYIYSYYTKDKNNEWIKVEGFFNEMEEGIIKKWFEDGKTMREEPEENKIIKSFNNKSLF